MQTSPKESSHLYQTMGIKKYTLFITDASVEWNNVNKMEYEKIKELQDFFKIQKGFTIKKHKDNSGGFGSAFDFNEPSMNAQTLKLTSFRKFLTVIEHENDSHYISSHLYRTYLERFLYEGTVHNKFHCKNFPHTYDVFAIELVREDVVDVLLCIRMEKYDKIYYQKLSQKDMLYLVRDILTCLMQVHKSDFVHRDIQDKNVMFDSHNNSYVLIDWGTSREFHQTTSTLPVCTIWFAAPEYLEMQKGAARDPRIDIYSVGALMYYWGCGCNYEEKRIDKKNPKLKQLSHSYFNIMKRALNKDPDKRYDTAEEMIQAVDGAIDKLKESENSKADKKAQNPIEKEKQPVKPKKKVSKVGRMMTAFIISYSILGILYLLSHYVPSSRSILNEEILKNICLLFGGLTAIGGLIELSTEIVEDIKGKKVKYIIIVILSIIVLALVGLVVKFYVVDPVVAGIRISNEGSIETYINEFQLQVNNKDVDEHFKYMTFYGKEEGYFDSDHLNEIIESSFSIKEEKSDILLRINDRTTTPGYPAQDKTDDTFGTLTKGKEVTVEIQRDDKTVDVEAYFLDNGKVYFEWMSFLNGMGFITNNPNNNTFNIITEGLSNEKDNNTIIENEKETNHRDISGTNNKSQQGTSIKNEPNTNETKTNVNTKVKNNNTVQHSEQTNPTTSNTKNNDVIEEKVEQSTDTVQEPTCPVCGSKYHTVHPTNDAPEIDIDFQ